MVRVIAVPLALRARLPDGRIARGVEDRQNQNMVDIGLVVDE
jgi:hypothetical protein